MKHLEILHSFLEENPISTKTFILHKTFGICYATSSGSYTLDPAMGMGHYETIMRFWNANQNGFKKVMQSSHFASMNNILFNVVVVLRSCSGAYKFGAIGFLKIK